MDGFDPFRTIWRLLHDVAIDHCHDIRPAGIRLRKSSLPFQTAARNYWRPRTRSPLSAGYTQPNQRYWCSLCQRQLAIGFRTVGGNFCMHSIKSPPSPCFHGTTHQHGWRLLARPGAYKIVSSGRRHACWPRFSATPPGRRYVRLKPQSLGLADFSPQQQAL